jgi:hypothetical protein
MNFATLAEALRGSASAMHKESWADAVEKQDDTLPPLPLAWVKASNDTVKVWQESEWTHVTHKKKRGVNSKPLGSQRR